MIPPIVAVASYALVAGLSVKLRAIWLWPVAAAVGAASFCGVWALLERDGIRWVC